MLDYLDSGDPVDPLLTGGPELAAAQLGADERRPVQGADRRLRRASRSQLLACAALLSWR